MELKDQVCTLEQAKILFDLIPKSPDSLMSWMRWDDMAEPTVVAQGYHNEDAPEYDPIGYMGEIHDDYPAYTVAELLAMMPHDVQNICLECELFEHTRLWAYPSIAAKAADTDAQSLAALLIYLLENNLHSL